MMQDTVNLSLVLADI